MKKLKLLPTILMLVLCVGVLAIGIYAITPTKNTISGSITINASNQPVLIEVFIDGVSQGEPQTVRSVKTWNVGDLEFVTTGKNTIDEVAGRTVTLRITNQSTTQSLGAYFFKNGTESAFSDGFATGDNIMLDDIMYVDGSSKTEADKIATVECTPYMYIAKNDDATTTNTIFDYVDMTLEFKPYQFMTGTGTYKSTINYSLNIEPYQANVAVSADNNPNNLPVITPGTITKGSYSNNGSDIIIAAELGNGTSDFEENLLKLPDEGYTTLKPLSFYGNEAIEHLVVPSSLKTIEHTCFIPSGLAYEYNGEFGSYAFFCPNLKAVGWCTDIASITGITKDEVFGDSTYSGSIVSSSGITYGILHSSYNISVCVKSTQIYGLEFSEIGPSDAYDGPMITVYFRVGIFDSCTIGRAILSNSITSIGDAAFRGCTNLNDITIPSSVNTIGDEAFLGCEGLTSINIPNGVTSIGDRAFASCTNLTSITIPEGVTDIVECAFLSCSSLTSITIPSSVTSIGSGAFNYCYSLKTITVKAETDLESAYTLPSFKKTGYATQGWYTNPEGTGSPVEEISANKYAEDTTYYFVGTPNTYTLTLNLNGGKIESSTANVTKTVTFASPVGELPTPTRDGYTFVGWSYSSSATTASASCTEENFWTDTSNDTWYAVWKQNTQ